MPKHFGRYQSWMYHRRILIFAFFLVQALILVVGLGYLTSYLPYLYLINLLLAFVLSVYMVNNDEANPSFRMSWLILMCLFPILGGLVYLLLRLNPRPRHIARRFEAAIEKTRPFLHQDPKVLDRILEVAPSSLPMARFLGAEGPFPTYQNTRTQYFGVGRQGMNALFEDLSRAQDFIFMEYFAVEPGELLDQLVDILEDRAAAGVEIRWLYDGYSHVTGLDPSFPEELAAYGIDAKPFNKLHPFLSTELNNRDHRKISIIDGKIVYTGGLNLADQYVNLTQPYGHWKDAMLRLEGDIVASYLAIFSQMWESSSNTSPLQPLERYFSQVEAVEAPRHAFAAAYADQPNFIPNLGKSVYADLIHHALDYIYMTSPYLILDDQILSNLRHAAQSKVDVQLIVPHVPDKRITQLVARTFYPALIDAGVRVFEYKPGFIHAKLFVVDDVMATVGSYNLDYRSFYLHYESGCLLIGDPAIPEIRADFEETRAYAIEFTMEDYKALPRHERFVGRVLKLFSALM